jgi:hypothetical protein
MVDPNVFPARDDPASVASAAEPSKCEPCDMK